MVATPDRLAAAREFVSAAQNIHTSLGAVQEIQRFLRDCSILAEPIMHKGRSAIIEREWFQQPKAGLRQPIPLRVVALFSSDAGISADWVRYATAPAMAFYVAKMHAIMVRPELDETTFVMGSTLIHEGNHALRALRQGRYGPASSGIATDELYFLEECEVTEMEGKLWREKGESDFTEVVNRGLSWLRVEISKAHQQPGDALFCIPWPNLGVEPMLNAFLGPAPNWQAARNRFQLLNTLAHFEAIDESKQPRASWLKAGLLATLHKMVGMPQKL